MTSETAAVENFTAAMDDPLARIPTTAIHKLQHRHAWLLTFPKAWAETMHLYGGQEIRLTLQDATHVTIEVLPLRGDTDDRGATRRAAGIVSKIRRIC